MSFFGAVAGGNGSGGEATLGGCTVSTLGGGRGVEATLGAGAIVGEVVVAVRIAANFASDVCSLLSCERNGEECCGLVMAAVSSSVAAIRLSVGQVAGIVSSVGKIRPCWRCVRCWFP